MGCATSLVKYIVFLFNFIFVLLGIGFIAGGVVLKLDIGDMTEYLEKTEINFALAPVLLIVVGCIVFVISFFGCCGAIRESSCMLITYAVILLTIFILQVAVGVYAVITMQDSDKDIKDTFKQDMKDSLTHYNDNEGYRNMIDAWQRKGECCGVDGPTDWPNAFSLPKTCCKDEPNVCIIVNAYKDGCFQKVFDFVESSLEILGIVILSLAASEVIGAIFAFCLSSSIRNNERRGGYA